jgi:hypothetical protein
MAKQPKPSPSPPDAPRCRGRPPKPGGRIPQVEVQRAYRARLAAAGKIVRIVDAGAGPPPPAIPDYNLATDAIYERTMVEKMRDDLRHALNKLELREEDVQRLGQRNAYLEGELRLQEQHLTNALKDNIVLKQQLAEKRPTKRR